MPLYRKTALTTAHPFLPPDAIPEGVFERAGYWVLDTIEGEHEVRPGDYICTGPKGERWNVAKDIFEETYQLVPD